MARTKTVLGLGAFVGALVLPALAAAQVMTFEPEDPGGGTDATMTFGTGPDTSVDQPPPPPQGPPSQILAQALRLYEQNDFTGATVQFQHVIEGMGHDEPANVQKAEFFLGKCLFRLRFFQAALAVFEEIVKRGNGHIYFRQTLQWLAQLSRELPEPADIISLVGRYGDSLDALAEFNNSETRGLYNELLYMMGRYWYRQMEYQKARTFFEQVGDSDEHYVASQFFIGITFVRERTAQKATEAFTKIVNMYKDELFLSDEEERFLNLAYLSLARIYYTTQHFASAMEAWDYIPLASEYWLDSVFEKSWAYYMVEDFPRALGNVHTINSPFFQEQYYPESLVLKAVIYFTLCQYDYAQQTVTEFVNEYQPVLESLQGYLDQYLDNYSFFQFLKQLKDGTADVPDKVARIIRTALSDRTLLRNLDYVDVLSAEEARLQSMPSGFKSSSVGERIVQDIGIAKGIAIENAGDLAHRRYQRFLEELQDLLNQATRIEIEILNAIRGQLSAELQGAQVANAPGREMEAIDTDSEHMLWPFEGEFWRDELGFYQQPVVSKCGR
jgi:tetratricopeptide (TPR) repeat protein